MIWNHPQPWYLLQLALIRDDTWTRHLNCFINPVTGVTVNVKCLHCDQTYVPNPLFIHTASHVPFKLAMVMSRPNSVAWPLNKSFFLYLHSTHAWSGLKMSDISVLLRGCIRQKAWALQPLSAPTKISWESCMCNRLLYNCIYFPSGCHYSVNSSTKI